MLPENLGTKYKLMPSVFDKRIRQYKTSKSKKNNRTPEQEKLIRHRRDKAV